MYFSDFAQKLKEIIGGENRAGDFVKELFVNITTFSDDDEKNIVEKTAPPTYRAYYNGERAITRFAGKIRKNIEPAYFVQYIEGQDPEQVHDIYEVFSPFVPGMTEYNVGQAMADLFKTIIVAACTKKKKKKVPAVPVEDRKEEKIRDTDFTLLDECGMKCPLCEAKLVETKKGVPIKKYDVVSIFPPDLNIIQKELFEREAEPPENLDSLDNKVLLCNKCAAEYRIDTEPTEYAELLEKKRVLAYAARLEAEAYDINVEHGINQILDALSGIKTLPPKEDKSKWKAFRVDKKIPDNLVLQDTVTEFVLKYYRYIEAQYKQREREGKLRFNKVKNEISQCFELYDEADLPQKEIFDKIVKWLKEKTNCDNEISCIAMVSFFVQNCEVFRDETS